MYGTGEHLERVFTYKGAIGDQNSQQKLNLSQSSRPYIALKLPCHPHGHTSSPTQCLFFICHGLHPCNAYFPLIMAYKHAFFFMPWVSCTCVPVFMVVTLLILSMTRCNCQLHLLGSPSVKAIYYTFSHLYCESCAWAGLSP